MPESSPASTSKRPSVAGRRLELERLSDSLLVERCAARDELAWEVLVRRYRKLVYTIPFRAGLQPHASEDVFQVTFARLSERIDSVRDRARISAWIVTTARRLTIDAIRSRDAARLDPQSEAALEQVADPRDLAPVEMERIERRHLVRQAMQRLGERCRQLLRLLFYDTSDPPRSYESIARELGVPIGSLGPTRARCLAKLEAELQGVQGSDV